MSFLKEFFQNRTQVGAISPSSKYLGRKMYGNLDLSKSKLVVEFGPGNGVFTREMASLIDADCTLLIFEVNTKFFQDLTQEFKENDKVVVLNESAEKIGFYINKLGFKQADFIVSSLPFTVFPKDLKINILTQSAKFLSPNGCFVQFQYSLNALKLLKIHFNSVKINFTPLNIPPAFIYKCSL